MPEDGTPLFAEKFNEDGRLVEYLKRLGFFALDIESGWSQRSAVMEELGHDPRGSAPRPLKRSYTRRIGSVYAPCG